MPGQTDYGNQLPVRSFLVQIPGGLTPSQFFGIFLTAAFAVTDVSGGFVQLDISAAATAQVTGANGQLNVSGDANQVISVAQQQESFAFNYTGALTADRNITFPAPAGAANPDPTAYTRLVSNNTSGGHNIVIGTGAGSTITLGPGTSILARFDSTGANEAVTAV